MKLKLLLSLMIVTCLFSCGHSQKDAEMIGQIKKVVHNTPLICPDYSSADISLGVIRNGVGSMSTQDEWLVIIGKEEEDIFRQASETGQLVKVKYDVTRFGGRFFICTPDHFASKVELIK